MDELSYKPSIKILIIAFVLTTLFVLCVAYFFNSEFIFLISIGFTWTLYYVIKYFSKHVIQIDIKHQRMFIVIRGWSSKELLELPLQETQVTYKNEVGTRGSIRPSLKVYHKNKFILEIISNITGWSDKALSVIAETVQNIKTNQDNVDK